SIEEIIADGAGRARGTGTVTFETTTGQDIIGTYISDTEFLGNPDAVLPVPLTIGLTVSQDPATLAFQGEVTCVPEPSTFALIGIASLGGLVHGWRRRKRAA